MIKTTFAALVAVAALSGASLPAFAATSLIDNDRSTNAYFQEDNVLARLQSRGIEATSVEGWGQLIRAYVVQEDGSVSQQFFNRDTLSPVAL